MTTGITYTLHKFSLMQRSSKIFEMPDILFASNEILLILSSPESRYSKLVSFQIRCAYLCFESLCIAAYFTPSSSFFEPAYPTFFMFSN